MTQSGGPQTDIQKYTYEHIIDPLRDFRAKVTPLNTNQIDGVNDFARTIAGLLTGSDGDLAWQGPASDALADLISQYLAKEEKLTGFDGTLQGRLLDASILCEKHAGIVEYDVIKFLGRAPSTSTFLLDGGEPGGENEEGMTPEQAVQSEVGTENWAFISDMQKGPAQEPLQELTQLPPFESTLPPTDNPLSQNLPADDAQTSTLGLSPAQEQFAEAFSNETGVPLDQVREMITYEMSINRGLTPDEINAKIRAFYGSLSQDEINTIGANGISFSDVYKLIDEHPGEGGRPGLTSASAIQALMSGPPGTTPEVVGNNVQGADILWRDSNGNVVEEADVKTFGPTSTYRSFRNAIADVSGKTGGTGTIVMQSGNPTQAEYYLQDFRRGPMGRDTTRFGRMRIIIIDMSGHVILDEPLIP